MCEKSKILGQIIRTKRKLKKMSVRVLAELTGIHAGAIIKFELGKTNMTIANVFKICEVLNISLDKISSTELLNGGSNANS